MFILDGRASISTSTTSTVKIVRWNFDNISNDSSIETGNLESNNFVIKWVKRAIFLGSNRSLTTDEWEQFNPGKERKLKSMYDIIILY